MAARHSCRAFRPEPIPRATIAAILTTAQKTASWNNTQPWQVVIASGGAVERFRALMLQLASGGAEPASDFPFPREYRGALLERRRACGFQLYDAVGVQRGDKAAYARQSLRNFALFDAPHVAIITTDEALGAYGALDCGAYVSNFMTAATAHGVATIAQAALAVHA
ncbi:MAG: nitroreductase family protein, partial [Phreatobacter sp.]|nr:nitroreductase family protein [Phreatobacter sp.]